MPKSERVHEFVLNGSGAVAAITDAEILASAPHFADLRVAASTVDHADPVAVRSHVRPDIQAPSPRVDLATGKYIFVDESMYLSAWTL